MPTLDLMTMLMLLSALLYTMTSVYIIVGVLQPLLAHAINGLVDLARVAIGGADGRGKHKAQAPS